MISTKTYYIFDAAKVTSQTCWDQISPIAKNILGIISALTVIIPIIIQMIYKKSGGYYGVFFDPGFTKHGRLHALYTQCHTTINACTNTCN